MPYNQNINEQKLHTTRNLPQQNLVDYWRGAFDHNALIYVLIAILCLTSGGARGDSFNIDTSTTIEAPLTLYDGEIGTIDENVVLTLGSQVSDLTIFEVPGTENYAKPSIASLHLLGAATLDIYGTIDIRRDGINAIQVFRDIERESEPDLDGRANVIVHSGAAIRNDGSFSAIITNIPKSPGQNEDIGTDIVVEEGASVESVGGNAIYVSGEAPLTANSITNYGTIRSAGWNAITVQLLTSIDNFGRIEGNARNRSGINSQRGAVEININNRAGGVIRGYTGMSLRGPATIINQGVIEGSIDKPGVEVLSISEIHNFTDGVIRGRYGIDARGAVTIVNEGTIEAIVAGQPAVRANVGVGQITPGPITLINSGSLVGGAVLSPGDDIVVLKEGSSIVGVINGNGGTDILRADVSFNVHSDGNPDPDKYLNFEIYEFIDFFREINTDTPEELSVVSGAEVQFTADSSINSLTVESGGNVEASASVESAGAVEIDGTVSVTANARLNTPSFYGTGALDIATGSTFTLAQAGNSVFAGQITGGGDLVKDGTGRLQLSGNNANTGTIVVRNGILDVDGTVASDVIVEQTGRLYGSGTFANITSSGVIAPGNSPGTMVSTGDVTLAANSTYEWEVDGLSYSAAGGAGSYDRIVLTNPASTFTAGGALMPILRGITGAATNSFTPDYGDSFTIVTTANSTGVVGSFASVVQPSSGLPADARFDVLYANAAVDLVVTPDSYASFAQTNVDTENALNFGLALDAVRPNAGLNPNTAAQSLFTNLYPLNGAEIAAALVPLAGEVHVFAVDDLRNNVERLGSQSYVGGLVAQDEAQAIWFDLSAERLRFSRDEVASSYNSSALSMWLGVDIEQRSDLRYGVAVGRSGSDVDANQAGRVSGDATMLMGYYATQVNNLAFGATLGIGQGSFDTERTAVLASGVQTETSSGDARFVSLNFNVAYEHGLSPAVQGTFSAALSTLLVEAGAYNEAGATDFASSLTEEFYRSGVIEVGYELVKSFKPQVDQLSGSASVGLGLRHEFGRDRQYTRELEMYGASWTVSGQDLSPTSAYVSFGADFDLGNGGSLSTNMFGEGNHDYVSYGAALNFVRRF